MSRISLLVLLILFANISFAQTTYTWVGGANGDFQLSSNWSPSRPNVAITNDILAFDVTTPVVVFNVPNRTVGAIQITSGTSSVTFTANAPNLNLVLTATTPLIYTSAGGVYAGDLLGITLANTTSFTMASGTFGIAPSSGGRITVNGALTLDGGTLDVDVVGTGGTIINSGASITYTSGTFVSNNASAITWANNSNYYHNVSGAAANAIPVAVWNAGSNCNITGYGGGSVAPTGLTSASFYNLRWNAPTQAGNINIDLAGLPLTITGNLNIVNTGASGRVRFTGTGANSITAGSYTQTGGYMVLQASSGSTNLTVKALYSQNAGTIDFVTSGATGEATLNLQGNVTKTTSTWTSSSNNANAQMNIQFSGSNAQVVTISGTVGTVGGRLNVINTNTDPSGVSIAAGTSLKVTNVNSSSAAFCSNAGNFTGAGAIQYTGGGAGGSVLIYNGSSTQTASNVEFNNTNGPANVTISSTGNVNFPFNKTITGTLTMTSGSINFGTYTLSLTNPLLASQLVYTNGFILGGTLSRTFPSTGLPTNALTASSLYPFGSGANSRFINIYFSSATGAVGGDIAISHTAAVNPVAISPTLTDAGVALDKRSGSYWTFNTGLFDPGASSIAVTAQGTNIGAVNVISTLRLTDAVTANLGTLIATTGTVDAPVVGKSGLSIADINAKDLYIGTDVQNPLAIVSFTWTGSGGNSSWTNSANWTSTNGTGYPSAPTENAVINNTLTGFWPVMITGNNISVYQLVVSAPAVLTMNGTSSLSVYDALTFTGTATFQPTSTFTYAGSVNQSVLDLPYGTLGISGAGTKTFPATVTVTGDFIPNSVADFTTNTNTFIYAAGATIQRVGATTYNNISIIGNRSGNTIRLGNGVSNNTIKVNGVFIASATNYNAVNDQFNTFDFASSGPQDIPGFVYGFITNSGSGTRKFDDLGSSDPAHVISCKSILKGTGAITVTTSKVKLDRTAANSDLQGFAYHDLEVSGNMAGFRLGGLPNATISIAGTLTISATNYKHGTNNYTINFNGTGAQTIPGYNANTATNTPAWKYMNLTVTNGNRDITLSPTDTIHIQNLLTVPSVGSFTSGGFIVTGSTVNFLVGSGTIPELKPQTGINNYNNLRIETGTRQLLSNLVIGGNLDVKGVDTAAAQLTIGNGSSNRTVTVLGNIKLNGSAGAAPPSNSLIDFNTGTAGTSVIKLSGNLDISNGGLITTVVTGTNKGTVQFLGSKNHLYSNTSTRKNGFVNFLVGDAVSNDTLTLSTNLDLIRSESAPLSSTFTVSNNSVLNALTKNITVGTDDLNTSDANPSFNLNAGATLITSNTGGAAASTDFALEGTATNGSNGTVQALNMNHNYNIAANYVLNGATVNPFPVPVAPPTFLMNKLTIGANVSLNRPIDVNGTLDIGAFTLTQATNNLEFNGYTSTTGKLRADQSSSIRIQGSIDTLVGAINFVIPGGNTTGLFDINKGITVPLGSDLNISNAVLAGNFVTGNVASVLDINGNTLSVDGAFSGPGLLAGSNTSNLTLNGTAGTVKFVAPKEILKDFKLLNAATASLGTKLDITGGTGPGTEGSVQIPNTGVLTTNGNLTIKSSADGTARIATGRTTGGYIVGDVSIERFLSSDRSWRLLSTPTVGQTIRQAWQENGTYPGNSFGTIITSNLSTYAANGFDFQTPGNSLLTYNSATDKWVGVPNTFGALTAAGGNKAYMLFLRGDRTVNPGTGNPSTEAIIRSKGAIFQGNLPAVNVNPGEFAAVSNNYASAIDFTLLISGAVNVDQSFTVWDPTLPGSKSLGGWVTFSAATGWNPTPLIPGPAGHYTGPNKRIESGQAFMIHNSNPSTAGTLTFKETDKISGSNLVSRPVSIKTILQTNLLGINNNGEALGIDGNTVVFSDEYSNEIDKYDAFKFSNFNENFGMKRNGKTLVVEARQPVVETDTVFLDMYNLKKQAYRIELKPENFAANVTAYLEDIYLHTTTSVSAAGSTYVDFEINDDAASAAADRFRVVFKNSTVPAAVLTASEKSTGIAIEWNIASETNVAGYELERSTDGQNFAKVFAANGVKGTNTFANYNWIDNKPVIGDNHYRVKVNGKNGGVAYSNVASVNVVAAKTGFSVFPNPVSDGIIGLKMKNVAAGNYTIKVLSNDGKLMSREVIKHSGGSSSKNITSAAKLSSGTYQVEITGPDKKVDVIRILVF